MTDTGLPGDNTKDAENDPKDARESDNVLEKVGDAVGSVIGGAPKDDEERDADTDEQR
ncbi:hypothetical protein [Microbacterium sp. GXF7504]